MAVLGEVRLLLTMGCFAEQVPWVVYYSKVGIELSKVMFKGQNMSPP